MHDHMPWVSLLFVGGLIGFAVFRWWFSEAEQTKRAIRGTPRRRIGDVRDGEFVKIVGTIKYLAEPLTAPLSGRRCAYFEARAMEKRGKSGYREIAMEGGGVEFLVEDGTGRAVIDPVMLRAAVVEDDAKRSGFLSDATPGMEAFLARHGKDAVGPFGFNRTISYKEGVFEEGEAVAVVGRATFEHEPDEASATAGYRDRRRRLRLTAPAGGNILISDHSSATKS
jgi:hypothetical protein